MNQASVATFVLPRSLIRAGKVLCIFALVLAGGMAVFSCSQTPEETTIRGMEDYLERLESDWNSGSLSTPPADEAMELKRQREAILALDPAVLSRELEKRRTRVLGEADLYLMVLIDEVAKEKGKP